MTTVGVTAPLVGERDLEVRRLRPADVGDVRRLVDRCSARSLRARFFGFVADPAALLRAQVLEAVWEGCAVGALRGGGLAGLAVGVPDGDGRWELAVLVQDADQGRGVGERVARVVLGEAASAGVGVDAYVEAANGPAMRLVRRLTRTAAGPSLRVVVC